MFPVSIRSLIFFDSPMLRYLVFLVVLITLFISSNGQLVDVCNSTNFFSFRDNNNGLEVCQSMAGNPVTYEFVPVCESSILSCTNCNLTCQNGGTCVTVTITTGISGCLCPQNWGGPTCNTRVDNCVLGTACLTDNIPFRICASSVPYGETYLLEVCQIPGVNCNPSSCSLTCQNNGTCITQIVQGNAMEVCFCANGYAGTLCDTMTTPFNVSTLCSAGYNVSAMWELIVLAVFALYVISVM